MSFGPVLPVVVIDDALVTRRLLDALADGGIRQVEITLRTPGAFDAIAAGSHDPRFTVGAGTVITPEQVDRCADLGARFIVSPGLDPDIVERARSRGLDLLPGVATASEVQRALRLGITTVKFFPADRLGGLATIRALAAPFPSVRFVPSGGVTAANAAQYLGDPAVAAVSGSWMAPRAAIDAKDWDAIRRLSAEANGIVQ